eukprot:g837.t1
MSFLRNPLERLTNGVSPVEAAAVGVSVFTVSWLAHHFREHRSLKEQDEMSDNEEGDSDSIDCLKHEELSRFMKPWDSDKFLSTEKCFHPLERVRSFNLELSNSELSPSETKTIKPLSLILDDGQSCNTTSSPEWQTCTRGLLEKGKQDVEMPNASWFAFFSSCCYCLPRSKRTVPLSATSSVFSTSPRCSNLTQSPFNATNK